MKIDFKDMSGLNVPKYCRRVMKKQEYPKTLEIYRGEVLCLTVDVEAAGKLRLNENSLYYEKFENTDDLERLKAWKNMHVSGQGCV